MADPALLEDVTNAPRLPGRSQATWPQRMAAVLLSLLGLALGALLLVFGFFIGAALLGLATMLALVGWLRMRWRLKRTTSGRGPPAGKCSSVIEAEYVVLRESRRTDV